MRSITGSILILMSAIGAQLIGAEAARADTITYCFEYATTPTHSGCPDPRVVSCVETYIGAGGSDPNKVAIPQARKYNEEYESYLQNGIWNTAEDFFNSAYDIVTLNNSPRTLSGQAYVRRVQREVACPRRIAPDRSIIPVPQNLVQQLEAPKRLAANTASLTFSFSKQVTTAINNLASIVLGYMSHEQTQLTSYAEANAAAFKKYKYAYPASVNASLDKKFANIFVSRNTLQDRVLFRWAAILNLLHISDGATLAVDFNNDGIKDYAILETEGQPNLRIIMAKKGSNPVETANYELNFLPRVSAVKIDADNLIDLQLIDPKGEWAPLYLINNGNGTFHILRPESYPKIAISALSSTACFTRVSSNSTFCVDVGGGAPDSGSASFGFVRKVIMPIYEAEFVGQKFATRDQLKVRIKGRPQPGIDRNRMGTQVSFVPDAFSSPYVESCSQSQSNYSLICNYETSDAGIHWYGRCACTAE